MPHWCPNNFQYYITWNAYHFHDNSEQPLRHPAALSIIKPVLPPSAYTGTISLATCNSPRCQVVRGMNFGALNVLPLSLKEAEVTSS